LNNSNAPSINGGKWVTDGWQGSVLRASEVNDLESVNAFFDSSYKFLLNQLKNK